MQPARAHDSFARLKPWLVCFALGSFVACTDGLIGKAEGPKAPGTSGGSGTGGGSSQICNPDAPVLTGTRVWRLTQTQLKNTLNETFGFSGKVVTTLPEDSRLNGYANQPDGLGISSLLADYYFRAADEIGIQVLAGSSNFLKCAITSLDATCLGDFLNTYGAKAWRRPLSVAERTKLTQLYATVSQANGPELGLRMVVQAIVLSPNFLYRTELGDTQVPGTATKLTAYELASALSYTIWDGPPDAELLAQAASGKLRESVTLVAQARRLLSTTAKVAPALHSFIQQWLETDSLDRSQKDPTLYPNYTAQVAQALSDETDRFFDSVVFDAGGDKSLRTLLSAPYGFVNGLTAPLYGAQASGTELVKVNFNPAQRHGLLTQGAFLARHSNSASTGLVGRGRFVRETIMCAEVPPPPQMFVFDPTVITPDMTEREKFEAHRKNPACATCHALFDPIGIALENYDPTGQFRTTDRGKAIDPSGTIPLWREGDTLTFSNYVDMLTQLSATPEVYDCFSSQFFQYATGRKLAQIDPCDMQTVAKSFAASSYKLDELVLAVISSPGFAARRN